MEKTDSLKNSEQPSEFLKIRPFFEPFFESKH